MFYSQGIEKCISAKELNDAPKMFMQFFLLFVQKSSIELPSLQGELREGAPISVFCRKPSMLGINSWSQIDMWNEIRATLAIMSNSRTSHMNWLFCLTEMQRLLCNVESLWSTATRAVESQFLSHGCLSLSKHISGIYVLSYGN